jgi:hypothetical protein
MILYGPADVEACVDLAMNGKPDSTVDLKPDSTVLERAHG